jgi:DNA-binding Xre family transcriptional regulator
MEPTSQLVLLALVPELLAYEHRWVLPQEQFGRNVRALRKARDMTQEELAAICGLHPTEISRLERGVREARLGTITRLARALKVKPGELLADIR